MRRIDAIRILGLLALLTLPAAAQAQNVITGRFLTPTGQTPVQAGVRPLSTVAGQQVYAYADFRAIDAVGGTPLRIICGGNTYAPLQVRAYVKGDGTLMRQSGAAGQPLTPTEGCSPSGVGYEMRMQFGSTATAAGVTFTEVKAIPDEMSSDWADLAILSGTPPAFAGYRIIQDDGTALTMRSILNIIGADCEDNATDRTTDCTFTGGSGGGLGTVEEADGSPSLTSITTLRFDQSDGFTISNPGSGIARVDFTIPSHTNTIGNITGLQAALDAKLALAGGTMTGELALRASGLAISGGGLSDCKDNLTQKLGWDASTARFVCNTDQTTTFTDSSGLRALLSDENGTGAALFDQPTNPTLLGGTFNGFAYFTEQMADDDCESDDSWIGLVNGVLRKCQDETVSDLDTSGAVLWSGLYAPDGPVPLVSNQTTEVFSADFQAAFSTGVQFLVKQSTGNPTGGTLFGITVNDDDVLGFALNDGMDDVISMTRAGVITARQFVTVSDGGEAGSFVYTEGSAPNLTADAFTIFAPADVASGGLAFQLPAAASTGYLLVTDSSGVMDMSIVAAASVSYATIQEEGSSLTVRHTLNFVGAGFTAADDSGNARTTLTLDGDLNALAALSSTGLLVRSASDTYIFRSIAEGNYLDVTNGDGVSGNPTVSFDPTELASVTWASGSGFAWTFDAGATDPILNFASGLVTLGASDFGILNQGSLRLYELTANGSNYVSLAGPASLGGNISLTFAATAFNCSGFANGGKWTVNGAGVVDCADDEGGGGGSGPTFVDFVTPSGTINGSNDTFTLTSAPSPSSSLIVIRNGLILSPTVDYTLTDDTIVFESGSIPQTGDILRASYRTSDGDASFSDFEEPTGDVDGMNATFVLANPPSPSGSLVVIRNGLVQLGGGEDYTLSDDTITFESGSLPQTGDTLRVSYRY